MPEVPPVIAPIPGRITPENAREMALKSHESRRRQQSEYATAAPQIDAQASARAIKRLERIEKQLDAIDDEIDAGEHTASEWRDLTAARERLFKQWQVLANIPNPGNLKPTKPRSSRPASGPEAEPIPQ